MATASKVRSEPHLDRATGVVGAWVHGFDLDAPDNQTLSPWLQRTLAEHGVLFFDFGHALGDAEFNLFASLFGTVQGKFGQQIKDRGEEDKSPYIDSDLTPMKQFRINHWHADGGPLPVPPLAAILTAYELPEVGGDTMWASMYAAYDALSPHMRRMLDGMQILNNNVRTSFLEPREHVHPAVVVNPITRRKSLFVDPNYTAGFVGLPEAESDALLKFLFEHINTPEFHVRLHWKVGYAAIWHQQVVKHRGVDDFTGPRKLKRHTIEGPRLVGAAG